MAWRSIVCGRIFLVSDRILDYGYWPESILTPPPDEAIQYGIRMTKAMGFNGARKHQKAEYPRVLYWGDRIGFLVSVEMANAEGYDGQYADRSTRASGRKRCCGTSIIRRSNIKSKH